MLDLCVVVQVEVTKYEALEELSAEVKLKHLLWDSLEEWESLENSWNQVNINLFFHIMVKMLLYMLINSEMNYQNSQPYKILNKK